MAAGVELHNSTNGVRTFYAPKSGCKPSSFDFSLSSQQRVIKKNKPLGVNRIDSDVSYLTPSQLRR